MNDSSTQSQITLWGGTFLTMDGTLSILRDVALEVGNGKISSIRTIQGQEMPKDHEVLDTRGCLIMPGLINGHTHVGMTLLRGIADDLPFQVWLNRHIFPLERKLGNQDFVSLGSKLACLEMIRSGTTTFNDMYYFEEATAKAVHEMGLRAICGQTHIEISGVEKEVSIFEKYDSFFTEIAKYPRVRGALAPHSIYGISERLWKEIVKYAEMNQVPIHTHLCETKSEVEQIKKERKKTPVEWFDSIGVFERETFCAHAIELSPSDIALLGRKKVGMIYNPESNLKLANGICPVVELRAAGCPVAFGTDSTASNNNLDVMREADVGTKLQTYRYGVGKLTAQESVKMLTIEGARAIGLSDKTGSLEPGKQADIIVLKLNEPHSVPVYDWYSHLVYSAMQSDVIHTIVEGQVLMKNRQFVACDAGQIIKESAEWGLKIAALNAHLQNS
jgi:5-methylthioadenosine/S-adenosylhomocysteine deaminase